MQVSVEDPLFGDPKNCADEIPNFVCLSQAGFKIWCWRDPQTGEKVVCPEDWNGACDGCDLGCSNFSDRDCAQAAADCERVQAPDGMYCSKNEDCVVGACQGGHCDFKDINSGADCGDGVGCHANHCDDQGNCVSSASPCGGPDACNEPQCQEDGQCVNVPKANGTTCGDGGDCFKQVCSQGSCTWEPNNDGKPCSDGEDPGKCRTNVCIDGYCDWTPADDNKECDQGGNCFEYVCEAGDCTWNPINEMGQCDDGGTCYANVCMDGSCTLQPQNEGVACANGEPCLVSACSSGTCVSSPVADQTGCGDGGQCHDQVCVNGVCVSQSWDAGTPCVAENGDPGQCVSAGGDNLICMPELFVQWPPNWKNCTPAGGSNHPEIEGFGILCRSDQDLKCGIFRSGPDGNCDLQSPPDVGTVTFAYCACMHPDQTTVEVRFPSAIPQPSLGHAICSPVVENTCTTDVIAVAEDGSPVRNYATLFPITRESGATCGSSSHCYIVNGAEQEGVCVDAPTDETIDCGQTFPSTSSTTEYISPPKPSRELDAAGAVALVDQLNYLLYPADAKDFIGCTNTFGGACGTPHFPFPSAMIPDSEPDDGDPTPPPPAGAGEASADAIQPSPAHGAAQPSALNQATMQEPDMATLLLGRAQMEGAHDFGDFVTQVAEAPCAPTPPPAGIPGRNRSPAVAERWRCDLSVSRDNSFIKRGRHFTGWYDRYVEGDKDWSCRILAERQEGNANYSPYFPGIQANDPRYPQTGEILTWNEVKCTDWRLPVTRNKLGQMIAQMFNDERSEKVYRDEAAGATIRRGELAVAKRLGTSDLFSSWQITNQWPFSDDAKVPPKPFEYGGAPPATANRGNNYGLDDIFNKSVLSYYNNSELEFRRDLNEFRWIPVGLGTQPKPFVGKPIQKLPNTWGQFVFNGRSYSGDGHYYVPPDEDPDGAAIWTRPDSNHGPVPLARRHVRFHYRENYSPYPSTQGQTDAQLTGLNPAGHMQDLNGDVESALMLAVFASKSSGREEDFRRLHILNPFVWGQLWGYDGQGFGQPGVTEPIVVRRFHQTANTPEFKAFFQQAAYEIAVANKCRAPIIAHSGGGAVVNFALRTLNATPGVAQLFKQYPWPMVVIHIESVTTQQTEDGLKVLPAYLGNDGKTKLVFAHYNAKATKQQDPTYEMIRSKVVSLFDNPVKPDALFDTFNTYFDYIFPNLSGRRKDPFTGAPMDPFHLTPCHLVLMNGPARAHFAAGLWPLTGRMPGITFPDPRL